MDRNWSLIATWDFSYRGICTAAEQLASGGDAESTAELVAMSAEDNAEVDTVGYGGWPNFNGEMELDAAMMRGKDLALGCVLGITHFKNPVSVARAVMNHCPHTVLIAQGAEDFADSQGCRRAEMLSPKARKCWEQRLEEIKAGQNAVSGHDTIGVLSLDQAGDIVAATSTSGLAMKHRGRVGDTPLIGSGFYADNSCGAAAATGVGEDIMRCCLSAAVVELIKHGLHPMEAAEQAMRTAHRRLAQHGAVGNMAVVCMDRLGRVGGAANHDGFSYCTASQGAAPQLVRVEKVQ